MIPNRKADRATVLLLLLSLMPWHVWGQSSAPSNNPGNGQWSVQVDRVDPGAVTIAPEFKAAIYENLLEELAKTKQFQAVYRSGDRNAKDVSKLLVLKVKIQKYSPGSETTRAVSTVSGATKLNVGVQLLTADGRVVFDQVVDGNVRFFGNNLRATHNLAHNVAGKLKQASLAAPEVP
jgi:hypothetical protein